MIFSLAWIGLSDPAASAGSSKLDGCTPIHVHPLLTKFRLHDFGQEPSGQSSFQSTWKTVPIMTNDQDRELLPQRELENYASPPGEEFQQSLTSAHKNVTKNVKWGCVCVTGALTDGVCEFLSNKSCPWPEPWAVISDHVSQWSSYKNVWEN